MCLELFKAGHKVNVLTRNCQRAQDIMQMPYNFIEWKGPGSSFPDLENTDIEAVVNLAGANLLENVGILKEKKIYTIVECYIQKNSHKA